MKKIEVLTQDNVFLDGREYEKSKDVCLLYIPGFAGQYNDFEEIMLDISKKTEISLVLTNLRSSYHRKFYKVLSGQNISAYEYGAAFDNYTYWKHDIDCWYKYASKKYKNIIVLCHSLGCNKVVDYISSNDINNILNIIFLSPKDSSEFRSLDIHKGMYEEATCLIKNKKINNILSKKFLNFCEISARTYLDLVDNPKVNNLKFANDETNKKIKIPSVFLIGSKDGGDNLDLQMKSFVEKFDKAEYKIIFGANHTFKHHREELKQEILNILIKVI